jgi:hypothetical protein
MYEITRYELYIGLIGGFLKGLPHERRGSRAAPNKINRSMPEKRLETANKAIQGLAVFVGLT